MKSHWFILFVCLVVGFASARAEDSFSKRVEQTYLDEKLHYASAHTNLILSWHYARSCFDWAEFATNDAQRETLANEGVAACREAIVADPKLAPAHYYLAMNLGQLARTKSLGALPIVREMERTFATASELDETFDYAGPDRSLGILYLEAPVWPSIGNRKKAQAHLEKAVKVAPNYPDNYLTLIEAYLKWGEYKLAQQSASQLETVWTEAKTKFTGAEWEPGWADWSKRWSDIQKKIHNRTVRKK